MSWRTRGFYKGLNRLQREWLRRFNRVWDTKAHGRVWGDAFDYLQNRDSPTTRPTVAPMDGPEEIDLTTPASRLWLFASEVARFTVPQPPRGKRGGGKWRIHLELKSGERVHVSFDDQESAMRAHEALKEAFAMLPAA